jgi:hypothetical protein
VNQQSSQQRKDATRLANLINANSWLYESRPLYRMMIDSTIFFTEAQQQESMAKIGGQYQDGKFLDL